MKIIITIILFFIFFSVSSQKNTAYIAFHPTDLGLGLRYDRQINKYGAYVLFTKGKYCLGEYSIKHKKAEAGLIRYCKDAFYSLGVNYHWYQRNEFKPLSINIGVGVSIANVVVTICMDPLKGEGGVGFGIKF